MAREDLTGMLIQKQCDGYSVDGIVVKCFATRKEQVLYGCTFKGVYSVVKCNLCGTTQTIRNNNIKDKNYRCSHCKGYGHLFNTQIENTEWTVLRLATKEDMINFNKENRVGVFLWCRCSCGKEQPVDVESLKNLESTKCKECSSRQLRFTTRTTNKHGSAVIGEKYNMLTVVELTDKKTNDGHYLVRCECDCGNTQYFVTMRELRNGRKSCGCIQHNPDLTDEERQRKRNYPESERFKYNVKAKANHTCDCCGYKGCKHDGVMKAHHLNGWHWYDKDKRDDITNGVCLCMFCHDEFHDEYGQKNNTKEQYIKFKNKKSQQTEYWHKNNTVKPDKVERKCIGSGKTYVGKDANGEVKFIGKKPDIDKSIYNYTNVCSCTSVNPKGRQKTHKGLYWSILE